jgi:DNA-binding GntR family transcriptional regulator
MSDFYPGAKVEKKKHNNNSVLLSEKAYYLIREQIISMKMLAGSQVDERTLEKELSIGRTPIREAIQRLSSERLLDYVQGRGYFVKTISLQDIKDIFESMMILERTAVYFACKRIDSQQLKKLYRLHDEHQKATLNKDYLNIIYKNGEIHRTIYEAARNLYLLPLLNSLQDQSMRMGYIVHSKEAHPTDLDEYNKKAVNDHYLILKCFENEDDKKAIEVMADHINRFYVRVCLYMGPKASPPSIFLKS